jgi:putative FmdB family regulatory protein
MPLYDYLCESCGERTEILQRFNDLPEVACPKCGAPMRRLPSAPSFQFKGSGFYLTDYAKKSGGTEGSSTRGGGEKSGDKSGDKPADRSADKSGDSGAAKSESSASPSTAAAPASSAPASPSSTGGKSSSGSGGE